jgi:uncharacterized membrane protein
MINFIKNINSFYVKKFLTHFLITFLVISFLGFVGIYFLFGTAPFFLKETVVGILLLTLIYSFLQSTHYVMGRKKIDDIEELTRGNYWKLKKELNGKVTKRKK